MYKRQGITDDCAVGGSDLSVTVLVFVFYYARSSPTQLPPTPRRYRGVYDYCTRCGACVRRCPARAISLETGKDQLACWTFLNRTKLRCAPRYGCGKCQVAVPCERRIPPGGPAARGHEKGLETP